MSNFEFMQKIDNNIYSLANTAEKLFRDEYFDQCITQTRKLAETLTKEVLGSKAKSDDTFDDMIYKLKTIACNNFREKEFIEDMYFLKKQGNVSTHSVKSANDGKTALECLERSFEACINFATARGGDKDINKLIFDEKLLVLGEKNKNLQNQYKKELEKEQKSLKIKSKNKNTKTIKPKKQKPLKIIETNKETKIIDKIITVIIIFCILVFGGLVLLSQFSQAKDNMKIHKVQTVKTKEKKSEKYTQNHILQTKNKKTASEFTLSKNFSK